MNYERFWNNQKRPKWAGPVTITTKNVLRLNSNSDVRARTVREVKEFRATNPLAKNVVISGRRLVSRPVRVKGVICPIVTSTKSQKRETADVLERNLHLMPEDRGHVMALSLGAPNVSELMVNQPRMVNQKLRNGNWEEAPVSKLSWRALELFALWCAVKGQTQDYASFPNSKEEIVISRYKQFVTVNKDKVEYPRPGSYAGKGKLVKPPKTKVIWDARLHYPNSGRGNTPSTIEVTLSYDTNKGPVEIVKRTFVMRHSISQEGRYLDGMLARHRTRMKRIRDNKVGQISFKRRRSPRFQH